MQLIEALEALAVDKLSFLYRAGGLDDSAVTGEPFLYLDRMISKSSPIAALGVGHVFGKERKHHAHKGRLHKLPCAGHVIADIADVQLKVQTDSGARHKARARRHAPCTLASRLL